ncbi:hypothetical protein [Cystobacter fuscus]|uniref:hypothetical protein n=1 Tax=Cystobacter fuscus TaxID=43 RepID=UPI000BB38D8F|nr:hypothetical protein [Cystobacter fuscus]
MAPSNTTSGLDHATDQAGPLLGAEVGAIAPQHAFRSAEQQRHGAKLQKAILAIWGSSARPFAVGGVVTAQFFYLLSKFPEGLLWGPIELPGVGLGTSVAFASFTGSLVVGGTVNLVKIIAPPLHHYWGLFEVWSKYLLGRISPEQYFEHGAVLDYQRLYGHMPSDSRPETQAEFVRRVVQWRRKRKLGNRKGRAKAPVS